MSSCIFGLARNGNDASRASGIKYAYTGECDAVVAEVDLNKGRSEIRSDLKVKCVMMLSGYMDLGMSHHISFGPN